jgi:hypothetical protein
MIDITKFERAWMLMTNAAMMVGWSKVLKVFYHNWQGILADVEGPSHVCLSKLDPTLRFAVITSFLEFFNAMVGYTRSKPQHVLLFAVIRASVELLVAPLLFPVCNSWPHLFTALCWSIGDTIRFFCFVIDTMVPGGTLMKRIRYTVGPLIFPFGAAGEMIMVATLAHQRGWYALYIVAALWIVGFYPLFMSLLSNRRKFLAKLKEKKEA